LRENILDKTLSYTIIIMQHICIYKDTTVFMQRIILVFKQKLRK